MPRYHRNIAHAQTWQRGNAGIAKKQQHIGGAAKYHGSGAAKYRRGNSWRQHGAEGKSASARGNNGGSMKTHQQLASAGWRRSSKAHDAAGENALPRVATLLAHGI